MTMNTWQLPTNDISNEQNFRSCSVQKHESPFFTLGVFFILFVHHRRWRSSLSLHALRACASSSVHGMPSAFVRRRVVVAGASHAACYLMLGAAVVVVHHYDRSSFSTLAFSGRRRSSYRFLWALSPILFRMRRQSFVADLVVLRWFIASERVRCPRFACRMYVRSLDYIHVTFGRTLSNTRFTMLCNFFSV